MKRSEGPSYHVMPFNLLEHFCPPVVLAALDAGQRIMEVYCQEQIQVQLKDDQSPVTMADKAADKLIMERLQMLWDLPVVSEESQHPADAIRTAWRDFWLVDPLDGTREFLKRNGEFTVNIALIHDGQPCYGVVYAPALKTLYLGAAGLGARKVVLGQDCSSRDDLVHLLQDSPQALPPLPLPQPSRRPFTVAVSRSHHNLETDDYIQRLEVEHGTIRRMPLGSSLKMCLIAEGTVDIYPKFGPTMHWDTAAAHAILRAAGGDIRSLPDLEPLRYDAPTLTNPHFLAFGKEFL